MKPFLLLPVLLLAPLAILLPVLVHADDRAPYVIGSERFGVLGPSYFITGFEKNDPESTSPGNNEQVKFHISMRYRMTEFHRGLFSVPEDQQLHLYFAFTQTSFWNLWDESAPFFDNNFQPESFLYYSRDSWPVSLAAGARHQSNGREDPFSRSWNRVFGAVHFGNPETNAVFGSATSWYFGRWSVWGDEETNPDITDYFGYGKIDLYIAPGQFPLKKTSFPFRVCGILVRFPVGGRQFIPGVEASLFLGLPNGEDFSPSLMIQYVDGYGQRLLDYQQARTAWRVGLALIR